jgi:hypothetical protein
MPMLHLTTQGNADRRKDLCLTAHNPHKETTVPLAGFEHAIQASQRKKTIHDLNPTDNDTPKAPERFAPRTLPNLLLTISFRIVCSLFCTRNICQSVNSDIKSRYCGTVQNCTTSGPIMRPFLQQTATQFRCARHTAATHALGQVPVTRHRPSGSRKMRLIS